MVEAQQFYDEKKKYKRGVGNKLGVGIMSQVRGFGENKLSENMTMQGKTTTLFQNNIILHTSNAELWSL